MSATAHRLEGRALACSRGMARLFNDVSFEVASGEWLAVRGSNGSGKTTLLRCVAGLTRPDSGEVRWNGANAFAERRVNSELLYAGHLPGIKDDLSAEENLAVALALRGVTVDAGSTRDALVRAGLEKRRQLPARRLSAGQRRRIGLARLLVDPAACWLLDEPLTALDDEGRELLSQALAAHLARGGLALVATHQDIPTPGGRELRIGR